MQINIAIVQTYLPVAAGKDDLGTQISKAKTSFIDPATVACNCNVSLHPLATELDEAGKQGLQLELY